MESLETLKYPIGKFEKPDIITKELLTQWINEIENFPGMLKKEVNALSLDELKLIYRPGGWNILQVIHHCANSHMNGFIRHKLTLTENNPVIKPYMEALWAEQPDDTTAPILHSLVILEGVHARWAMLLNSLNKTDLIKKYIHPEHNKEFTLEESIGVYAWHGKHHLEHIRQALKFKGSFSD